MTFRFLELCCILCGRNLPGFTKTYLMKHQPADPFVGAAITTILVVSDMQKSKTFYVESLGATLFREYGADSVVLQFLEHWILLVLPGGPTNDKPGTSFIAPTQKNRVSHSFTIRVNDCVDSYEILKAQGVVFITPPVVRGNETRCFFYDPDGHLFEISEYRSS
jgi:catechol 2,3-dioxygenase-like lactoylglutathione lyase family enzyme